jgi:hypothetical protein
MTSAMWPNEELFEKYDLLQPPKYDGGLLYIALYLKIKAKELDCHFTTNDIKIILKEWIYQGKTDKKKSEKDVYKKAKELNIINDELYNELFILYEDRNRVIHRFIISEITMAEVEDISHKYYNIRERMKVIVDNLESEQIRLRVGMTTEDENDPGNKSHHMLATLAKIGSLDYFMGENT